jgi:hypothetical protein
MDELKLRFSYGLSANDDIGNYQSRRYYQQIKFRETTGVILGTIPVTDLKYEEVRMFDAGLDFSVLGERFNFRFDYFNSKTRDLLIFERQDPFIGYSYLPTNGGELKNTGIEAGLSSRERGARSGRLQDHLHVGVADADADSRLLDEVVREALPRGHPLRIHDGCRFSDRDFVAECGQRQSYPHLRHALKPHLDLRQLLSEEAIELEANHEVPGAQTRVQEPAAGVGLGCLDSADLRWRAC